MKKSLARLNKLITNPISRGLALVSLLALTLPAWADYPNTNTTKFVQWPATNSPQAIDIEAMGAAPMVADDFLCTNSGPITDLHIWGSWQNDRPDPAATFQIEIWTNVPETFDGTNLVPSHPGTWLWYNDYGANLFLVRAVFTNNEPFLVPGQGTVGYSSVLWQYNFDPAKAINFYPTRFFSQQGSITNQAIYWLSVRVYTSTTNVFGWKTSTNHFSDYAVYTMDDGGTWPLVVTPTNLLTDMAFALTTTNTPISTNAPSPTIAQAGPQIIVTWPQSPTNYTLQSTTNLSKPNWLYVTNGNPIVGLSMCNTLPVNFFRLVAPVGP